LLRWEFHNAKIIHILKNILHLQNGMKYYFIVNGKL
jgi:hypothetical protein